MMTEELDFDAEIPVSTNLKIVNEVEYSASNVVKEEFGFGVLSDIGEVKKATGKVKNNTEKTDCDTGEVNYNTSEIDCNTEEINFDTEEVAGDIEKVTGDTEEITGDTEEITGDTEEITGDTEEITGDTEEITGDTEEITGDTGVDSDIEGESDTGDVESDKCIVKSVTIKVESGTGRVKSDTERAESVSDTGEVESDTGEIYSDAGEIPNNEPDDKEEGELDEDILPPSVKTKTSEVVCRFFQRGTCFYGSQCRNPHFPHMAYNMFDPVLSNRSNFQSFKLQNGYMPYVFQPNPMPMEPYIESSWERGIQKAKVIMQSINLKKQSETSDDHDLEIENDWERCLEEAKANIQKSSFKRKTVDIEKSYFNSNYSKQEKFRERSPMKREYDVKESSKLKYSKNFYSKYENESNYKRRPKPIDVKPILEHLKFVDPWRRSRSPKKRTRSMSFSISPSPKRSRDRSDSSSSSSCFKEIYGQSHKVKTARQKSRSHSASPHSKKSKTLSAHTYTKKHSYSKSVSRSFSKSPRKRLDSRSFSRSPRKRLDSRSFSKSPRKRLHSRSFSKSPRKRIYSSSSSESSGKFYVRKKPHKERKLEALSSKVVEIKNGKQCTPSERPKNTSLPLVTKSSFKKICYGASSPSNSESSSAGSYFSYTDVSSFSDLDDLKTTFSEEKGGKSFIKREQVSPEKKKKETYEPNKKKPGNNQSIFSAFRRLSEDFDAHLKPMKPLPDSSKLQVPSDATTKSKSHSDKISGSKAATSHQSSKPNMIKKLTDQKLSAAAMELLMYHSFGPTDNKNSQAKNTSLPPVATKSKYNAYFKVPITKEVASKNTPDVQFKSKPMKITVVKKEPAIVKNEPAIVKRETVSKRKKLLQQLHAIEDAIARKKQPT